MFGGVRACPPDYRSEQSRFVLMKNCKRNRLEDELFLLPGRIMSFCNKGNKLH
ncbi:hypothetical protein H650_12730 [Enterobacter sp. R4-368]|nr:hypothetical protein H650_12730 [Enterobacter sp. R4-368]